MDKTISIGQNEESWNNAWNSYTPDQEIQMWDFYGGRQWISKYVPRYGKTVEAGCGLGRYNFYFSRMGIDIEGIDFSKKTIDFLNAWKTKYGYDELCFKSGDITQLPYESNSLRGYISLGVIEHFIEGPQKPLAEAFRVLEPGGIAIITTPSVSWFVFKRKMQKKMKDLIKRILGYKKLDEIFFQYEYNSSKLKKLVENSGLKVTAYDRADLLYTFNEAGNFQGENIKQNKLGYWISDKFEDTIIRKIGAQSITISIKLGEIMFCFLCGEKKSTIQSLKKYSVPICQECQFNNLSKYYKLGTIPHYAASYIINPPIKGREKLICEFSREEYFSDEIFEDFGFTKKVSPKMLRKKDINILLCNEFIQPIWRKRNNKLVQ